MRKYSIILMAVSIFCLTSQYTLSQISEGGSPVSFSLSTKMNDVPVVSMSPVNTKALLQEDEKARMLEDDTPKPFRFGYAIDVDIDIKKAGVLTRLPDGGKLWMLKIQSADAYSINLIYNRFRLSEGSKFFIYNEDKTMVLGAFTPEVSNNPSDRFSTDLVQGNTIVLEYYEPESADDGVINISKVIHGYVNTFGRGASRECNVDVNCPLGNDWENEKKAVALILVNNNTSWCTGCLVNNTREDMTPYFLTANHCLYRGGGLEDPSTWLFRFKYWSVECNSDAIYNGWLTIEGGATLRANYAPTDFALLELNKRPSLNYNMYYAGWDRTDMFAQKATGIHHPVGDVMKISYVANANNIAAVPYEDPWISDHWGVLFSQGTVEIGSSGSPLFNQDHRIIGQLHGAPSCEYGHQFDCTCGLPEGSYGRFDLSWEGGGTRSTRLKDWLDPLNTGVEVLDGKGCEVVNLHNETINDDNFIVRTIEGCEVNVDNVIIGSDAYYVEIIGHKKIEIISMVVEEGSSVVINNGTRVSQSSSSSSFSSLPSSRSLLDSGDIEEDVAEGIVESIIPALEDVPLLYQNAPNPFTGETVIRYYVPQTEQAAWLRIIDINGTTVKTENISDTGEGQLILNANALSSGIYFYSLMSGNNVIVTKRMVVGR